MTTQLNYSKQLPARPIRTDRAWSPHALHRQQAHQAARFAGRDGRQRLVVEHDVRRDLILSRDAESPRLEAVEEVLAGAAAIG